MTKVNNEVINNVKNYIAENIDDIVEALDWDTESQGDAVLWTAMHCFDVNDGISVDLFAKATCGSHSSSCKEECWGRTYTDRYEVVDYCSCNELYLEVWTDEGHAGTIDLLEESGNIVEGSIEDIIQG